MTVHLRQTVKIREMQGKRICRKENNIYQLTIWIILFRLNLGIVKSCVQYIIVSFLDSTEIYVVYFQHIALLMIVFVQVVSTVSVTPKVTASVLAQENKQYVACFLFPFLLLLLNNNKVINVYFSCSFVIIISIILLFL